MPDRSFRRWRVFGALALLLALAFGAVSFGKEQAGQNVDAAGKAASAAQAQAQVAAPPASPADDERPLSQQERASAERALEFHNAALNALETGYYALPDALYANARFYLKAWRLPARPASKMSRKQSRLRLKPEAGLFSEAEEATLASALDGMDKALDALLGRYKELEDYVADGNIRDDGARGKQLAARLEKDHETFLAARDSWLEIVQARAQAAEDALLRGNPLQRQIKSANAVFACFAEVAETLGADQARQPTPTAQERAKLERIQAELGRELAQAGKPPFATAPDLERRYRGFLKQAAAYAEALARGLNEGFFSLQRRELNVAAMRSRAAYNDFARAANGLKLR